MLAFSCLQSELYFELLNTASFPKMKENQVSFSCCNPNTTQKQLKEEWVCFDLGLQVACPSWEGRRQSRWLPGGWSVQGGPLFYFCSLDSSLFLSSVVRPPTQSLGGPQFIFLISSTQTFPKVCVTKALNPLKLTIKIPHHGV